MTPAGAVVGVTGLSLSTLNEDGTVTRRAWRIPSCPHAVAAGDTCPDMVASLTEAFGPPTWHEVLPYEVVAERAGLVTDEYRIPR